MDKALLIVDDDESIIKLFELAGKKFPNLQLVFSNNGSDALKKFKNQNFHLIITDLKMPKMDGIDFIQKLRRAPKNKYFPIMVMTGNVQEFDSKLALFDKLDIVEKPLKLKQIEEIYQKVMGKGDKQEALDPKEVLVKIKGGINKTIPLLLQLITKEKVESQDLLATPTYEACKFLVRYPIEIGGNPISLNFSYDEDLASKIKNSLNHAIDMEEPDSTLENIRKISEALIKKILDSAGYAKFIKNINVPIISGNKGGEIHHFIDKDSLISRIEYSNRFGKMSFSLFMKKVVPLAQKKPPTK